MPTEPTVIVIRGSKRDVLSLRRTIERTAPGQFEMRVRERPTRARAGLAQQEWWELIAGAAVGGAAKAAISYLLTLLAERRKPSKITWRTKKAKAPAALSKTTVTKAASQRSKKTAKRAPSTAATSGRRPRKLPRPRSG